MVAVAGAPAKSTTAGGRIGVDRLQNVHEADLFGRIRQRKAPPRPFCDFSRPARTNRRRIFERYWGGIPVAADRSRARTGASGEAVVSRAMARSAYSAV